MHSIKIPVNRYGMSVEVQCVLIVMNFCGKDDRVTTIIALIDRHQDASRIK